VAGPPTKTDASAQCLQKLREQVCYAPGRDLFNPLNKPLHRVSLRN
jgi:hypothetical protein